MLVKNIFFFLFSNKIFFKSNSVIKGSTFFNKSLLRIKILDLEKILAYLLGKKSLVMINKNRHILTLFLNINTKS